MSVLLNKGVVLDDDGDGDGDGGGDCEMTNWSLQAKPQSVIAIGTPYTRGEEKPAVANPVNVELEHKLTTCMVKIDLRRH